MPDTREAVQRALVGSPLRSKRGGCIFSAIMFFTLGITLVGQGLFLIDILLSGLSVAFISFLLVLLLCLPTVLLIWYLDRREREWFWLLMGALMWGSVISTGVFHLFDHAFRGVTMAVLATLGLVDPSASLLDLVITVFEIPLIQETFKGLGLLILFWFLRAEFNSLVDGIIYGALIGVGVNITEFVLYALQIYVDTGEPNYTSLIAVLLPFGGFSHHVLWSGLFGAGVGLALHAHKNWQKVLYLATFFGLAYGAHSIYNAFGLMTLDAIPRWMGLDEPFLSLPFVWQWLVSLISQVLLQGVFFGGLVALLYLGARWEVNIIRRYLADEVGTKTVTRDEYERIKLDRVFRNRRLPVFRGPQARALINAQNELAFRKWQVSRQGQNPEQDPLVNTWRADVIWLRRVLENPEEAEAEQSWGVATAEEQQQTTS